MSIGYNTDSFELDLIDQSTTDLVSGYFRRLGIGVNSETLSRTATFLCNNDVHLDVKKTNPENRNARCLLSSNGLFYGYHEFSIHIKRCAWAERQEIGVVSSLDVDSMWMAKGGVRETTAFGARAIFGSTRHANYYVSLNDNKVRRSFFRLSVKNVHINQQGRTAHHTLKQGDVIRVSLDLKKGNIKFYINEQKPKTMTLQKNKTYYPFVAFVGNCEYELTTPEDHIDFI